MPVLHQFSQVLQLIPAPSVLLLPDAPKFTIAAVNNAYLEAVNLKEEDLIGKGIFEAFPENPEDKTSNGIENLRNSLNIVIAKKDSDNMPLQKYDIPIPGTLNFKVKYANVKNIPLKDNINITYILHSIEDVTEKKNLEIAVETEKQRFNDLYLQAPSCMGILKGSDHVYEMANPTYLQLINKKNIIGKSFKEIRPEAAEQGFIEILNQVYKTGIAFSAKEKLVKLDKEANGKIVNIYVDTLLQPHKDNTGKIDGILFFFIDVTEKVESRKKMEESEKRYRELIENLPVATYSCDVEGHILIYNKAAINLWGREPESEKDLWCGAWKIYNEVGDPIQLDNSLMAKAIREGKIMTSQELIVERPNGEKVIILPYIVPFKDSSGRVTGAVNVLIDITETKKEQEKLRKINKELSDYKYALDESCIVAITDQFGTIKHANNNFCKISQFSREELIGQNHRMINSGYHSKEYFLNMWKAISKGEIWKGEIKNKAKDGSLYWVDTIITPFLDEQGKPYQYVATRFDITDSKKAEQIRRESEKKYRQIVETAQEGIWLVDEDNKTTFVNNKLCEILGYTQTEMIGKGIFKLMDAKGKDIVEKLLLSKRDIYTRQSRFKFFSKSGKEIWTRISSNPIFDEADIYKGSLAMVTDITESKKSDDKIVKLNRELNFQNEEKKVRAAELVIANEELDFQNGEKLDRAAELIIVNNELEFLNGEKEHRATELIIANKELEFQNGEKEIRAAELSLSNKELLKTNTELDRFVYSVSHDLRAPLTSILGLISFIEEDSREQDTLKQIKMIRASIHRLDGFIKNILNYSRNNRTGLEMEKISIKKSINEIVDSVRNIKETKGISFEIDIDERKPFYSDGQRLNTILENLISNAIKHHSEEISGRYIKVTGSTDNEELKLSISDNGIGIEAEYHEKIFGMFYRLSGKTPGSGFGLYIVKEAVEKLYGTIEVQSEKGVGTTFIITLKNLKI